MSTVQITLIDTPTGGVAIRSSFKPAIGAPCSPAQGHALEIINRTLKQWGDQPTPAACGCSHELTTEELQSDRCATCGKAVLS